MPEGKTTLYCRDARTKQPCCNERCCPSDAMTGSGMGKQKKWNWLMRSLALRVAGKKHERHGVGQANWCEEPTGLIAKENLATHSQENGGCAILYRVRRKGMPPLSPTMTLPSHLTLRAAERPSTISTSSKVASPTGPQLEVGLRSAAALTPSQKERHVRTSTSNGKLSSQASHLFALQNWALYL